MKLLLDHNIPHALRLALVGHDVYTAAYMGWASIKNGRLMATAAADGFEAMITIDGGIAFEQHLAALPLAVLQLEGARNRVRVILSHVDQIQAALAGLPPCGFARIIIR